MAHSVPGFPLCNYFYANTEPGGEELVAHGVLDFTLYNYFSVDMEPGRKERVVAHGICGFSSV
jgi:hypothetical protein